MAAKRRKRKGDVVEDLPNPGERQRCRLPDWWGQLIRLNWSGRMPGGNNWWMANRLLGPISWVSVDQPWVFNAACTASRMNPLRSFTSFRR